MKKSFILLWFLVTYNLLYSQNQSVEKIKQVFGNERFQQLVNHYPDSLKYYIFIIEDGFSIIHKNYVHNINTDTMLAISLPTDAIVNGIPQKSKINILTLPVTFLREQNNYYQISETEYILKLSSLSYIEKKSRMKSVN